MSKDHNALKEVARKILQNMGYTNDQIKEEYTVGDSGLKTFRVDVVGLSPDRKVAIECGETPGEKIAALKMFFDEVIVLPYFTVNIEAETSAKTIRQLNEKIIALEKRASELEAENKKETERIYIAQQLSEDFVELMYRWTNNAAFFRNKHSDTNKQIIQRLQTTLTRIEKASTIDDNTRYG